MLIGFFVCNDDFNDFCFFFFFQAEDGIRDADVTGVQTCALPISPGAPLRIVFENAEVAVADKPAGQPTAPLRPGETGTLVNAVLGRYPELVPAGPEAFIGHAAREPGIIHRLDTET